VAGTTKAIADVDTAALPDEHARKLRDLVNAARVFDLPAELPGERHPDAFGYGLTITDDAGNTKSISFELPDAPQSVRDLVSALRGAK
jgi:hypothetical protein